MAVFQQPFTLQDMVSPTVDIIVPVWNRPFETRACLASIMAHSPAARMIIVDNGSSRETELMLEEFSEPLGENGLFIKSEKNVGLVPAINMGLARSDSDYTVVLGPHAQVTSGWLDALLEVAQPPQIGIVSPVFRGQNPPDIPELTRGSSAMETFGVSFAALMIKAELHMQIGRFDEEMDAGEWCLKDYIRRAWSKAYQTFITSRSAVLCGTETAFGSERRREERLTRSIDTYHQRWGSSKHYVVYFDRKAEVPLLADQIETILLGARQGHRFTLLLHRGQASSFHRLGWSALHTGIQIRTLSALMPQKDILRQLKALQEQEIVAVMGTEETAFPGADAAIPFTTLARAIGT